VRTSGARPGEQQSSRDSKAAQRALALRPGLGWRTSDGDEIDRRLRRAAEEPMQIADLEPAEPFFGTFAVATEGSLAPYRVEIRSLTERSNSCTCPDFRVNGLGTCKHVEAVLLRLRRKKRPFEAAAEAGSPKVEVVLHREGWGTKTAQAVKRLASPYAFVLTGTPLENRIDEIYSIIEFLDPQVFGPLFRFNREFYVLDDRGRPAGYANLDELRRRIRPLMLRRRKDEVEEQLPGRIDNNYFVEMSAAQRGPYEEYQARAARLLAQRARKRPLTREEHERLQKWLSCMRMLCDTTFILDPNTRVSPKLEELGRVFEDVGVLNGRKALVFSEWERMLSLVRDMADELGLGYAWHTGSVDQAGAAPRSTASRTTRRAVSSFPRTREAWA